jgi:type IV pilus assembly protein PilB
MPLRKVIHKQLGELLIEKGLISAVELKRALHIQDERGGLLGQILVELGYVEEKDIALALTAQYGFPYLPLDNYEIDSQIVKVIPARVARQYLIIPIDKIGNSLTVAMADPLNVQAIEDVEMLTNCVVQTFVSTATDIKKAIDKFYKE